jgi:hypothetical protein
MPIDNEAQRGAHREPDPPPQKVSEQTPPIAEPDAATHADPQPTAAPVTNAPQAEQSTAVTDGIRGYFNRAASQLGQSRLAQRATETVHKSSPLQRALAVSLLLLVIVALFVLFRDSTTRNDPEQRVIAQWLDAQLAGGTGEEFMAPAPNVDRVHFHSLRHWQLLSKLDPGLYLVEISTESSEGGVEVGQCRVTVANASPESGATGLKVVRVDFISPQG